MDKLYQLISEIPGDDWWKSASQDIFEEMGKKMVEKGFTVEETVDILEKLYFAVAACYGD